jgi:selenophosphate synthase
VRDPEIKFGYAITGVVDPDDMMTNAAGRPGDVVV